MTASLPGSFRPVHVHDNQSFVRGPEKRRNRQGLRRKIVAFSPFARSAQRRFGSGGKPQQAGLAICRSHQTDPAGWLAGRKGDRAETQQVRNAGIA
jgi:hypothetical protein